MKRMLFNATQQEELRVAIVDGQKLIDIDIETAGREQRKGNIYKGVISRIEPSLEAYFVNYGEERHGFLPFKEIAPQYLPEHSGARDSQIAETLREGQELRETMAQLPLPEGTSLIARTAGINRSVEELQWDLNYLSQLWRAVQEAAASAPAPFLIYLESSLVIRAIRDYFQPDISEILVDTAEIEEQARAFVGTVMPDNLHKVKRYHDDVPLFSRFQIEHQIESAYARTVLLPSGGAIVIDHTEALVSIDVNSARATKGADIKETALRTNLEAADEAARQLRLRDLGGLIVIDFIDMESQKHQRDIEQRLKDAIRHDRARVQMGKISRFGLMELSRQRIRPSLSEGSHVTCPRCHGTGHMRDTESSALQVLRLIQEEAMKEHTAAIHCQAPVEVTAFLLNEKRQEINKIEARFKAGIMLIPNKHLDTPHYKLERLRHDDPRLDGMRATSYRLVEQAARELESESRYTKRAEEAKNRPEAAVKRIAPEQPAPASRTRPHSDAQPRLMRWLNGWIKRALGLLNSRSETARSSAQPSAQRTRNAARHSRRRPAASSGGTARPLQMLDAPRRAQSGVQSVQKQPAFSEQAVREEAGDAGDGLEAQTAAAPEGRETLHKRRRRGRRSAASQAPELRPESQTVQNTLNKEKAEAIFNDPSPSADHASRLVQVDTDAEKLRALAQDATTLPNAPRAAQRTRRPKPFIPDTPMSQIETVQPAERR